MTTIYFLIKCKLSRYILNFVIIELTFFLVFAFQITKSFINKQFFNLFCVINMQIIIDHTFLILYLFLNLPNIIKRLTVGYTISVVDVTE